MVTKSQKYQGTGVALVTPFKQDCSLDLKALEDLVAFNIDQGVDYLVVLGTTGESVTLTKEEKKQVVDTVIKINNSRVPLVLGIGGNSTNAVVDQIKETDLSEFSAILSVSPYYNKPSQKGIFKHYSEIARSTPKDIIMYNVPSRTASNILPETVLSLAKEFENMVAVKEASGDLIQAIEIIKNKPKNFSVISGDDMLALPMTLAGGAGVISVLGQGLPAEFTKMIRYALKSDVIQANQIYFELFDLINQVFEQGNPAGIKTVLKELKGYQKTVRLPLVETDQILESKIIDSLSILKNKITL